MTRDTRAIWTETELQDLLTSYFGHKLEPLQVDQLIVAARDALAERGRVAPARHDFPWLGLVMGA
jgi:hypothetical protein